MSAIKHDIDEGARRPTLKLDPAFIELPDRPCECAQIAEAGIRVWGPS